MHTCRQCRSWGFWPLRRGLLVLYRVQVTARARPTAAVAVKGDLAVGALPVIGGRFMNPAYLGLGEACVHAEFQNSLNAHTSTEHAARRTARSTSGGWVGCRIYVTVANMGRKEGKCLHCKQISVMHYSPEFAWYQTGRIVSQQQLAEHVWLVPLGCSGGAQQGPSIHIIQFGLQGKPLF